MAKETETLLGTNLRNLRRFYKIPIKVLAEKLEVNKDTILRWERGEIYPSAGQIGQLQELYNLPLDVLTKKKIIIGTEKENKITQEDWDDLNR